MRRQENIFLCIPIYISFVPLSVFVAPQWSITQHRRNRSGCEDPELLLRTQRLLCTLPWQHRLLWSMGWMPIHYWICFMPFQGNPSLYCKRSSQVCQVEVIRRLKSKVHSCKLMLSYYSVRYISIYMKQLIYYFKQICIIELSSKYFMVKYSQHMYGHF